MSLEAAIKPLTTALVLSQCRRYTRQGAALAQVYADLSLAQRWLDLALIELSSQNVCVLVGRSKAGAEVRYVLPFKLDDDTSLFELESIINALQPKPDALTLGIVATDSSTVYYTVKPGIVSPKEAPDE